MALIILSLATNKYLALGLVLEFLLVNAFWANDQADIVYSLESRQENLGSKCFSSCRLRQVFGTHARYSLIGVNLRDWCRC